MKKIFKNKHVLIVGSGHSLTKYWNEIDKFIKNNDLIIIGCNHVNNVLIPDYNIWASSMRWNKYGKFVHKESKLFFAPGFSEKLIRKYWNGSYKYYDSNNPLLGGKKYKSIYNCFKQVGAVAIVWAYQEGASKISIVGMDGYTYYTKKQLKSKKYSQHSEGKGLTLGWDYRIGKKQDKFLNKKLKLLYKYSKEKYGFGFKILTPTVHTKYYNPKVLDIKEKYEDESISKK